MGVTWAIFSHILNYQQKQSKQLTMNEHLLKYQSTVQLLQPCLKSRVQEYRSDLYKQFSVLSMLFRTVFWGDKLVLLHLLLRTYLEVMLLIEIISECFQYCGRKVINFSQISIALFPVYWIIKIGLESAFIVIWPKNMIYCTWVV